MCNVASEMERRGLALPLLIGGATTSKVHPRSRSSPSYTGGPTVYVPDASRAVGVASGLLSEEQRPCARGRRAGRVPPDRRAARRERRSHAAVTLAQARANGLATDWAAYVTPKPALLGVHARIPRSRRARPLHRLDATFPGLGAQGSAPRILADPVVGETARNLLRRRAGDARAARGRAGHGQGRRRAVAGQLVGDDIAVYGDEERGAPIATLHPAPADRARAAILNVGLAHFVAPAASGVADYVGAFAVTDRPWRGQRREQFERDHDDYNAILFNALCDRLAEALDERVHQRVRREAWGYAPEGTTGAELIYESYPGIRPAPGYGCQPDHTEKRTIFDAARRARARRDRADRELRDDARARRSRGLYLSHPQSRYFGVGRIGTDQLEDYAAAQGLE